MGLDIYTNLCYGINLYDAEELRNVIELEIGEHEIYNLGFENAVNRLILERCLGINTNSLYISNEIYKAQYEYSQKQLNEYGVAVTQNGSEDDPYYILCARGSKQSFSNLWEPKEVTNDLFVKKDVWDEQLQTFCKKFGITYTEPKWLISSYYSN
jgi:hypothetical protein